MQASDEQQSWETGEEEKESDQSGYVLRLRNQNFTSGKFLSSEFDASEKVM